MQSAALLREKLERGDVVVGVLITNHLWLDLIECCVEAKLDYAIIDSEHFDHGSANIADACALGRLLNFPILVRPPWSDATTLRLALDLGPCGLLVPMVETADKLDSIAHAIHLPPRGERRPGGRSNRWLSKFDYESFRSLEEQLIIVPQIESALGLRNAGEIAQHSLTTAVGIGPFDLSARLGVCGSLDSTEVQNANARICQAAKAANKATWSIGDCKNLVRAGIRFVCVGDPTHLLQSCMKDLAASIRRGADVVE
jgi:4-hydroxy-2-oxoheptanedioate aldolase